MKHFATPFWQLFRPTCIRNSILYSVWLLFSSIWSNWICLRISWQLFRVPTFAVLCLHFLPQHAALRRYGPWCAPYWHICGESGKSPHALPTERMHWRYRATQPRPLCKYLQRHPPHLYELWLWSHGAKTWSHGAKDQMEKSLWLWLYGAKTWSHGDKDQME